MDIGNAILVSFTISYEIVFITLEMFYNDSDISIHIIYLALRHSCRMSVISVSDDRNLDLSDEAGPHKGSSLTKSKLRVTKGTLRYVDK